MLQDFIHPFNYDKGQYYNILLIFLIKINLMLQ